MTMFCAVTLLSFCFLLTFSHAIPSLKKPSVISRDGHLHTARQLKSYNSHLLKRALTHHVSYRAQPLAAHVIHLFENRIPPVQSVSQATLPKVVNRQGLVGEQCSTDADCQDPRQCITFEDGGVTSCTASSDLCVCFSFLLVCSSEDECDAGELCVDVPTTSDSMCVSEEGLASANVSVTETGSGTASLGSTESSPVSGLSGSSCSSDNDCIGSRACMSLSDTEIVPCSGQGPCACIAEDFSCSNNADCDSGEFCQTLDGEGFGICLITSLVPGNPAAQAAIDDAATSDLEDDEPVASDEIAIDTEDDSADAQKLNFEECESSDECAGTRLCTSVSSFNLAVCAGEGDCICTPRESSSCMSDDECDVGESCLLIDEPGICFSDGAPAIEDGDVSEQATAEPEPSIEEPEITTDEPMPSDDDSDLLDAESSDAEDADPLPTVDVSPVVNGEEEVSVCISAHHLSHMSQEELLYPTHRVARVLCDGHNSCATPGHIIMYEGVAMMMSSYCDVVGCSSKIQEVNSPRYYPGKVVGSNSDGLQFTAHAARYNTRVEERMLQIAVRIGL